MSKPLAFSKYQAAGNDFLLVDERSGSSGLSSATIRALCDRRRGVGADGVIAVSADPLRMRLVNADGTPAQISGNGLRCLAAFAGDRWLRTDGPFEIVTDAGVRSIWIERNGVGCVAAATVSMGAPILDRGRIPMTGDAAATFLGQPFTLPGGEAVAASALSMGNPHLVLFVDRDPHSIDVAGIGPVLERHDLFPERTNVEFAYVRPDGIAVRVWERGVGETLACGTGACAVAVAAQEAGSTGDRVTVRFPGGPVNVERLEDGTVTLNGPVGHVFDGVVDPVVA
jgi:diaminopimelate epimerase